MRLMETYFTKDLYLCALFMCNGFKLVGSKKEPEGVYFEVEVYDKDLLKKLITQFVNYTATVNLGKLTRSVSRLRRELDKYKNK